MFFDRTNERVKGRVEQQQQEHLRQTGERVLPDDFAKQNQTAG